MKPFVLVEIGKKCFGGLRGGRKAPVFRGFKNQWGLSCGELSQRKRPIGPAKQPGS
jgi:hypothetical protein